MVSATLVTIQNGVLRIDTDGNIVDCHSGNVVYHNGTYYMVGEHYGNCTGFNENQWPRIVLYTSPNLVTWTNHGFALNNAPTGTYYTPFMIYNEKTQNFVIWFNAYLGGCCAGNFGVAQSSDPVRNGFDIVTLNESGVFAGVDSNGMFVDDDGQAYIIYSSIANDHQVSIELLTPDYLHSTRKTVFGFFPDHYVEGPVLFKQNGRYYATYGSCCCFCRNGSGVVVYSASSLSGPWVRQPYDVNCQANKSICGGYGERVGDPLTITAQGIGLSLIPTVQNGIAIVWHGERWLSAPHNNPSCPDECRPETGICAEPPNYVKGYGYSYWIPIQFDSKGNVLPFQPFVDSFQLDLLL